MLSPRGECRAFKTHADERLERVASKLAGHVRKRLQQIRRLEVQDAAGAQLDRQQRVKMQQRPGYEAVRAALDRGDNARCAPCTTPRSARRPSSRAAPPLPPARAAEGPQTLAQR